jgi:hypothetical protein
MGCDHDNVPDTPPEAMAHKEVDGFKGTGRSQCFYPYIRCPQLRTDEEEGRAMQASGRVPNDSRAARTVGYPPQSTRRYSLVEKDSVAVQDSPC